MLKLKSDSIRASELREWCMAIPDEVTAKVVKSPAQTAIRKAQGYEVA